ncbi:DUF3221 domain-containing protein [Serpentinicella sp. ANB-PHB4]|uniref:DUF3221 domain-containing protein n=1 Tax=Serpentinicella sp. ANB-PHB4 TaxID=3074076 RepID=UPI00285B8655|nr:DUF3221 domain-containing protein [Serpentinicella sp. ANB-PHB4]MDR5659312.1 DUF3221 domain-containing protein [Serpentinicella sp. ANB-PHB4]
MMKKRLLVLILGLFVLFFMGCQKPITEDPDITGKIFEQGSNTILVVSDIDDVNVSYETWFNEGNNAIQFSVNDDTVIMKNNASVDASYLEVGQTVKVWSTGVLAESYPMQGTARQIIILK